MDFEKSVLAFGCLLLVFFIAFSLGASSYRAPARAQGNASAAPEPAMFGGEPTVVRVPAVDADGKGVVSTISVQVVPGSGRTLTNIDSVLFWVDTQDSIRTAREVAANFTGKDLSGYDFVYTINAPAQVVEGPSAGAALTVATIAEIQGRRINSSVMITGTIDANGGIGPVGSVEAKVEAARVAGAKTFLVPLGEGGPGQRLEREVTCTGQQFCKVEYVPAESSGINVIEVGGIGDAVNYMLENGVEY